MEDYSLFWQLAHALLYWEGSLKKQLGNGDKISYVGVHALYLTNQRGAYLDVKDRRSTSCPAQPNSVNECFVKWPTVFQVRPFFLPVFILHLAGSYALLLSFFRLHLRLCVCPSRGDYSFLMFFNKGSLEAKRVTW